MNTHVSTIPVVRDITAANEWDGDIVLVRLTPARAEVAAFASNPLALGMPAAEVIPTLLGEVKEIEVDLAAALTKAVKDDLRRGLYKGYVKRVRGALFRGAGADILRRDLSDANDSLYDGLRGLDR